MRTPQLYDYVYDGRFGKAVFQVVGLYHYPNTKYPTFTLMNVKTLHSVEEFIDMPDGIKKMTGNLNEILCDVRADMSQLYGIPLADLEYHFNEGNEWLRTTEIYERAEDYYNDDKYDYVTIGKFCDAIEENGKWKVLFDSYDPEPEDIEFLHELQQYHRGLYGSELFE